MVLLSSLVVFYDTERLKSEDNASENISGEDFSSGSNGDENAVEDFGSLINADTDSPKKSTLNQLMSSVENIQKSVNQLAAAVAVTKSIDNSVTPSPDSSVPTTSRRSVDIESLIANGKSGRKGGRKKNGRKNSKSRKNKGCFSLALFLYISVYGFVFHVILLPYILL